MPRYDLLQMIVPPALARVASNLRRYGHVRAVPEFGRVVHDRDSLLDASGNPWEHPNWLAHIANGGAASPEHQYSHVTALMMLCAELGDVEIFDFGGGPASLYPVAKHAARRLNYVVLENESIAAIGSARFPDVKFIQDATEAPKLVKPGGIALCVGTLCYILDWRELLPTLVAAKPRYVVFGRQPTPATERELWGIQEIYTRYGYCGEVQLAFIPSEILARELRPFGYELYADIPLSDQSRHVDRRSRAVLPEIYSRTIVFKAVDRPSF